MPDGIQAFFQPAPDLFSQFNQLGPAGRALDQKDEAVGGKAEEPPMISRKGTQFFRNVAHEPIAYVKAVDGVDLAEAAAVHQKNCAAFSIPACNCSAVVQGSKDQRNQAMAMT